MKKFILTVALFLTSMSVNAQEGVVTIETGKSDVPIEQWYVIRDKEFNNHSFFYAETEIAIEKLKEILATDEQSIDSPKGKDENGDPYWVILKENEYLLYLFLTKDSETYSVITLLTE
jgi:hypothetical protein